MNQNTSINTSSVPIKTADDLAKMRIAGRMAASTLEMIGEHVVAGISTGELDKICHDYITKTLDAVPAPLNYNGFPKSICTSINQVVCHGIPTEARKLKKGDIINIDVTVIKDGFHGDTSKMFFVGKPLPHAKRLVEITQQCMYKAIEIVKPGLRIGDLGAVIQQHAEKHHYSVVRDFCGHGIGRQFHEAPQILHYGQRNTGIELKEGMVFTIEPMINAGSWQTRVKADDWTAVTVDGRLSAQYEHTLAVTKTGYEVLTLRVEETFPTSN